MRQQPTQNTFRARSRHDFILGVAGLAILLILLPAAAQAQVTYAIWGQAAAVRQSSDSVESNTPTEALPGVTVDEPEQEENPPAESVALPGVTVEIFRVDDGARLGTGKADSNGWYNVAYMAPLANHEVRFVIYFDYTDLDTGATKRELVGRVEETAGGDPIDVTSQSFRFDLLVPSETFIGGPTPVSPVPHLPNEFLFIEVGDIDIDDIRDQDADSLGPTDADVGLTKATALVGAPPGRSLGPDHAFGGNLEIYGLFGPASTARFYRINWTRNTPSAATGSINVPLYKKNFVIAGTGVEVYRTLLGPKDVTIGLVTLTGVYELDERMVGQPIPGHLGKVYSTYWTELGLRAWWKTASLPSDGKYTLSIEAWDAAGGTAAVGANDYADIDLHVVNTRPVAQINEIQYLDGFPVLTSANPCQGVTLNLADSDPDDDSLQFEITANHPSGFFHRYTLSGWYGHNTRIDGTSSLMHSSTTPAFNQIVSTPGTISYQSCAYRFRLRTVPRITNGYHRIYRRDDNWYACIGVTLPP